MSWFSDARQFLKEVDVERRKVTWPAQREYVGGTIGVVVIVAIITTVLGVVDFGLSQVVQLLIPK